APQPRHDLLIAQWPRGVLKGHEAADHLLRRLGGDRGAIRPPDARSEEVLELDDALRRLGILARRHPAHRGLAHPDVARDVPKDHRPEVLTAVLEVVALTLDDRLRHSQNGLLALVDAPEEPLRGRYPGPDVRDLFRSRAARVA